MSLHDFYEPCVRLKQTTRKNNLGDTDTTFEPGEEILAGIYSTGTSSGESAGAESHPVGYCVITDLDDVLAVGDVIMRKRDKLTLRITSNSSDRETPAVAVVKYHVCNAVKERAV